MASAKYGKGEQRWCPQFFHCPNCVCGILIQEKTSHKGRVQPSKVFFTKAARLCIKVRMMPAFSVLVVVADISLTSIHLTLERGIGCGGVTG